MTSWQMPDRVHDEGLQLERTTLAWDRTALTFLANGLLMVRLAGEVTWVRGPGFVIVALAGLLLVLGRRRYVSRFRRLREEVSPADPRVVRAVGLAAVAVSGLALLACASVVIGIL